MHYIWGEELPSLVSVIMMIIIGMVIIGMIIMTMISRMIIILDPVACVWQDSYVSSVSEQSVSPTHQELIHWIIQAQTDFEPWCNRETAMSKRQERNAKEITSMRFHRELIHCWTIQAQTEQPGISANLGIMWRKYNDHSPRAHTLQCTESSMINRNIKIKDLPLK